MKKIIYLFVLAFVLCIALNSTAQIMETFAGNGIGASTGDGGPATAASFYNPSGVFKDHHGNLYVVEYTGCRVRKINAAGIVSTFAGNGICTYGGDGGPATNASFNVPIDIVGDLTGNMYIVDNVNERIRKVDTNGIITTFAGNGGRSYTGDGGPATNATMHDPDRVGVDAYGNVYFADANNYVVRKVDTLGIITTVVGNGVAGYSGDGGPATAAQLQPPLGVAFDGNGNMYVADGYNHVVRKITPAGIISTYAGNGTSGISGDGGLATAASMELPGGVAIDRHCNVYVTDWYGQNVRKIATTGIITTVAGNDIAGFTGDGGPATVAEIHGPDNITFDGTYNIYIADFYNNRVREVLKLGDTSICPSLFPSATFMTSADSTCTDSCITVTSTSTGTIDSVRWVAAGATIASATSVTTTICFPVSGTTIIHLYIYGLGTEDSSTLAVTVHNCSTGITDINTVSSKFWISQTGNNSLLLYASQVQDEAINVSIYDATGKKLLTDTWEYGTQSKELNGLSYAPGLYLIKLSNSHTAAVLKWMKQ